MIGWMYIWMEGWNNGYDYDIAILLLLQGTIAANTLSTEAIKFTARAGYSLAATAVMAAYATATANPMLGKWECLYCDWSQDILWNIAWTLLEVPWALLMGFPSGYGYISKYIPPLVKKQIHHIILINLNFISSIYYLWARGIFHISLRTISTIAPLA